MNRNKQPPILTRRGQVLYHLYRHITFCEHEEPTELSIEQFLDYFVRQAPSGPETNCCRCGRVRKLINGFVCLGCTRRATRG